MIKFFFVYTAHKICDIIPSPSLQQSQTKNKTEKGRFSLDSRLCVFRLDECECDGLLAKQPWLVVVWFGDGGFWIGLE